MNREIKFRGKIEQGLQRSGEWVYGYYCYDVLYPDSERHHWINGFSVDPQTVGQYIGFTDDVNKEIYEGDIVEGKIQDWDDHKEESREVVFTSEVKYVQASFKVKRTHYGSTNFRNWMPIYASDEDESLVVVGNIYETPELLNQ